ncbi:MAG: imidazoleglycerol-phosphate dehydratase HisB [Clostridiales bacterium]|nr:imidazoleglycerol-phosphate dehydratase HisB [Clostridiales bacterium]
MRNFEIKRKTNETDIKLFLELDGQGEYSVSTGCAFLDHMLCLFARHGKFNLSVECNGDTDIDFHHTTEDIGICLGLAFKEALGDKKGIRRYGSSILPMDEALSMTAVDFSGRSFFKCDLNLKAAKVGDFDTELAHEFFQAFASNAGATLHVKQLAGENAHHVLECVFKGVAVAVRQAVEIDPRFANEIPSTKGVL